MLAKKRNYVQGVSGYMDKSISTKLFFLNIITRYLKHRLTIWFQETFRNNWQECSNLVLSKPQIHFLPHRGDFTRGIFATAYTSYQGTLEEAKELYKNYYANDPFTHVSEQEISLKQVINSNNCFIHLHLHEGTLLVTSVIDNLIKGASGQAVQNMNLMFGLDETTGLNLKATYF